jgi:hypothetical protein
MKLYSNDSEDVLKRGKNKKSRGDEEKTNPCKICS